MSSNSYPLIYQCKATGKIIRARRRGDQSYSVEVPGQEQPERYAISRMRKEFKFIGNEQGPNGIKVKER